MGLAQKLNPATPHQADNLMLTHHWLEKNANANIKRGDKVIFNPTVTTHLTEGLLPRIHDPAPL